jgi:hypothetical protein
LDAQLEQLLAGGGHLVGAAPRMLVGAVDQPVDRGLVEAGQLGAGCDEVRAIIPPASPSVVAGRRDERHLAGEGMTAADPVDLPLVRGAHDAR